MKILVYVLLLITCNLSIAQTDKYFEEYEVSIDTSFMLGNCNEKLDLEVKLKIYTWHGGKEHNFDTRSFYLIRIYEHNKESALQEIIDSVDNWVNYTNYNNLDFIYDCNFDGQSDLVLCNYAMTDEDKKYYKVFKFKCASNSFEFDKDLSGIVNPHYYSDDQMIYSFYRSNNKFLIDEYELVDEELRKAGTHSALEGNDRYYEIFEKEIRNF